MSTLRVRSEEGGKKHDVVDEQYEAEGVKQSEYYVDII